MDKYEFNLKVEQLKKMVASGDYTTAMKIADSIDWRRVRNVGLLTTVSEVYEKNRDYTEAKNVLLDAYECAPRGKGILYKLTILALKEGAVTEAEAYYKEFYSLTSDDPRGHILRYLILKEKHAPIDQMIHSLEIYNSTELDEKWLYELAELYHEAGQSEKCVATCDKLMLMFGIGKYVDKAIELKQDKEGVELTSKQQELIDKRDLYEEKLREVQREYESTEIEEDYEEDDAQSNDEVPEGEDTREQTGASDNEDANEEIEASENAEIDDEIAVHIKKLEEEEKIKEELKDQPIDVDDRTGTDKTKIYGTLPTESIESDIQQSDDESTVTTPEAKEIIQAETNETEDKDDVKEKEEVNQDSNLQIIKGMTPEENVSLAIEVLKGIHERTGSTNPVAKIKASKLNARGLMASLPKIEGKDLLIDEAGDLEEKTVLELIELIQEHKDDRAIVLADNPRQISMLAGKYPELVKEFGMHIKEETTSTETDTHDKLDSEDKATENAVRDTSTDTDDTSEDVSDSEDIGSGTEDELAYNEEEMGLDEFAEYAAEYAKTIDCSISGKSMLALYERIEVMEEDGIPLTKKNAENLIEEAADRAEKPPLGAKLKGLFSAKYDKDGMLILKEEHFIV